MIGVLGAARVDGKVLRSRGQRVVLAALALEPGAVVPADRLAELVWGADLPANWVGALQSHVSRLRKALPDGIDVSAQGAGYRLTAAGPEWLDSARLTQAHDRATAAPDPAAVLAACDEGLAGWAGTPFEDLDDARAMAERARLTALATGLQEMRVEALVALGRRGDALADLEAMRAQDPLRERTVEQLMHLLMAEGRKSDALAAYAALKDRLVEELGLDPEPPLRRLRDSIVMETYESPFPAAASVPPPASFHEHGVPARAAPLRDQLVGRDAELDRVVDLLASPGAVTIAGPGGVGKTRLALQVARPDTSHFDRVDVVELAGLTEVSAPDDLADVVASELGIPAQSGIDAAERVVSVLRTHRRLLVLDNCEHLVEAAAGFVDRLLRSSDRVHVLATTREPLNVEGEYVVRLRPLAEDDALELLCRRIEGRGWEYPTGGDAERLLRRITRAVDGLPLGIELAAAHCETMTLAEIADALLEPLEMLARGRRTAETRHRSLRALVEWSARDLDEAQREVFARSAVFAGPFTVGALAMVTGRPRTSTHQALADLVDRSLVSSEDGPAGRMLHSTLETVRAYTCELLADCGDADETERRHGEWVLSLVEPLGVSLAGWAEAERADVIDVHLPDIRVAHRRFVESGDAARAVRLAASLHFVATYRMHAELFDWISETAERFGESGVPGIEAVLASASVGAWQAGDVERSRSFADRAAAVPRTTLDRGIGAEEALSDLAGFGGDMEAAVRLLVDAVARARAESNECRLAAALADISIYHGYRGDGSAARAATREARAMHEADGSVMFDAWLSYTEGESLADIDPHEAIPILRRAEDQAAASSSEFTLGLSRLTLAGLQTRVGDLADAAHSLWALLRQWRDSGARLQQWITIRSVLSLLDARGDHLAAARTWGVLTSDPTAPEITGADAERVTEIRRTLDDRVDAEEFGAWAGRGLDEVVDDLLPLLAPRPVRRASTW